MWVVAPGEKKKLFKNWGYN